MTASWLRGRGVPSAIGWAASGVLGCDPPSTPLRANGIVTASKSWLAANGWQLTALVHPVLGHLGAEALERPDRGAGAW